MAKHSQFPSRVLDEDAALRTILEGTATETRERFFIALVENLAKALKTQGAWITEYIKEYRRLRAIAFWNGGKWIHDYEYDIAGAPCEAVIEGARYVHIPNNILELYQNDCDLEEVGAVS